MSEKTILGNHMRATVKPELKNATRNFYVELLGCQVKSPNEQLDLFSFGNQTHLGVFYSTSALSESEIENAIWLEVKVSDPAALVRKLESAGVPKHPYQNSDHHYFRAPGGQIFRVASLD